MYKMAIIGSSMAYVVVGLIYLSGNDQVSNQIEEFENGIIKLIEDLLWVQGYDEENGNVDPFYLSIVVYLNR